MLAYVALHAFALEEMDSHESLAKAEQDKRERTSQNHLGSQTLNEEQLYETTLEIDTTREDENEKKRDHTFPFHHQQRELDGHTHANNNSLNLRSFISPFSPQETIQSKSSGSIESNSVWRTVNTRATPNSQQHLKTSRYNWSMQELEEKQAAEERENATIVVTTFVTNLFSQKIEEISLQKELKQTAEDLVESLMTEAAQKARIQQNAASIAESLIHQATQQLEAEKRQQLETQGL